MIEFDGALARVLDARRILVGGNAVAHNVLLRVAREAVTAGHVGVVRNTGVDVAAEANIAIATNETAPADRANGRPAPRDQDDCRRCLRSGFDGSHDVSSSSRVRSPIQSRYSMPFRFHP